MQPPVRYQTSEEATGISGFTGQAGTSGAETSCAASLGGGGEVGRGPLTSCALGSTVGRNGEGQELMLTHGQIHCWNVHYQPGISLVGKSRFSVGYFQPQVLSMNCDCRLLIVPIIEITMNLQCLRACSQGVGSNTPGALGQHPLPRDELPHPLLPAGNSCQLPKAKRLREMEVVPLPRTHFLCAREGAGCRQTCSLQGFTCSSTDHS